MKHSERIQQAVVHLGIVIGILAVVLCFQVIALAAALPPVSLR